MLPARKIRDSQEVYGRRTRGIKKASTANINAAGSHTDDKHDLTDKSHANIMPLLCLPAACRRTTVLGCPKADLTRNLVWPCLPQFFPALDQVNLLLYCFFWLPFLSFCPRDMSSVRHAFRPLHPGSSKIPISVYHASSRMNLLSILLAALRLAAAVTSSRLDVACLSRTADLRATACVDWIRAWSFPVRLRGTSMRYLDSS
jgi:hypothetical protein